MTYLISKAAALYARARLAQVSLTLRLALYNALFAGTMVAAVMGASYWEFSVVLRERAHAELQGEQYLLHDALARVPAATLREGVARAIEALRIGHPRLSVVVLPVDSAEPFVALGDEARELTEFSSSRKWLGVAEFEWDACLLASVIGPAVTADGTIVQLAIGMDRTADRDVLSTYRRRLIVAWGAGILLIGALAGVFARRSLAPLRKFSAEVLGISPEQLGRRVDDRDLPCELREFAASFNRLLACLDEAFSRLRAFSSDIAHELRSPLANLVGKTQVTLARARAAGEYRQALESNAEELERLTRMVVDMLFLARAENAATALQWEDVELDQLCREVAEFYEVAAEERGIRIVVEGRASTRADPHLIRRALGNLLSNSIRHTPDGKVIRLDVVGAPEREARIEVRNPGAGIAAELQPRIFDRFVHGDANRQRAEQAGAAGLGLAIVRSIMALHGGVVLVDSRPEGPTIFSLRFRS